MTAFDRPVAAIVPCRNEAGSLTELIGGLYAIGVTTVVVGLDPACSDDSAAVAESCGAVLAPSGSSGYDGPCLAALDHLRAAGFAGDVLFLDAGNKYVLASLARLIDTSRPDHDLTFGIRDAQTYWHQRLGNLAFAAAIALRFRHRLRDMSSVRFGSLRCFEDLGLEDCGFSLPFQTVVHALAMGKRIGYVPIECTRTRVGASKVSGSARNTLRAAAQMARSLAWFPAS